MSTFHVPLKKTIDDSYDIQIGRDLFSALLHDLNNGLFPNASRIAIITDSNVAPLYANKFLNQLRDEGYHVDLFSFPAGELFKTRETKAQIEDKMLEEGFGRDSAIIAIGGGVVSDLAGFLAGTFGRGIPFATYSTTLLSAADASVGGKTAVDTPVATNLIGLFNQPKKVYIDINTWQTLPLREVRSGLAETVKHACLADAEFFEWLENNVPKIVTHDKAVLDKEACEHIAFKNCQIKYEVVKADERESNYRQVLNLGHTAGRSLEALCEYELLHGECVAIGTVIQAEFGQRLGFISTENVKRIIDLFKLCGLPTEAPAHLNNEELVIKMRTDKKVRSQRIRFVFQKEIGAMMTFEDGAYSLPLAEEQMIQYLDEIRR